VLAKEWSVIATRESFQDSDPVGFVELPSGDILAAIKKGGLYRFVWNGMDARLGRSVSLVTAQDRIRRRNHNLGRTKGRQEYFSMGEMATGVAHELNQPLAVIASYSYAAGLIVERIDGNPQELQDVLGKLEKQAVRAGGIVR
jgi:signal transduction histidine kinase